MKSIIVAATLCLSLLSAGAFAASDGSGVAVAKAWARATAVGAKTGAVYLTLVNKGPTDDRLVGASTPVATMAQLHVERMDGGVMKMRPVAGVDVKAGGRAVLEPGGTHIMLMGLNKKLTAGDSFPLTLIFDKAGTIETKVEVAKAGAMHDMDMTGSDMKGMDMKDGAMKADGAGK